ncbi:MAG: HD domain-containing protein [Rhodoplanes sp.]|uniref:HD domain-containing protein n=1 Tax=Rhodoplanes sp. TaxID=1968906 RepID=UPI0017FE6B8E|nr:HD domain-containing protein [Rhodoplanes sp.]NVO13986.1 HD domain-containing protein [Rhodoplanes sp.]
MTTPQRPRRPITDALRRTVVEDLPEIAWIGSEELRRKVVEAWAYALAESSFERITSLPAEGNPGIFLLKRGTQADHLRGVTRVATSIADEFLSAYPEADIDRDVVIAGGLVHDVGKPWEFDPVNRAKWTGDPSRTGLPSLRHPVYGIHVCVAVGLPEEVMHIVLAHSYEGDFLVRSLEAIIVHRADSLWWAVAGGAGLLDPKSDAILEGRKISPRRLKDQPGSR